MTEITITKAAAKQVIHSVEESNAVGLPLRIAIKAHQNGSFHYQMGFDDQLDEGDEQIQSQGVQVVLDKDSAARANRMTLDFIEIEGVMEFIFTNPNDPQYRPAANPAWIKGLSERIRLIFTSQALFGDAGL